MLCYLLHRSLCGIANADNGGVIYIGVLEDGRAKGVGLNRVEVINSKIITVCLK